MGKQAASRARKAARSSITKVSCIICTNNVNYMAIGECNHTGVCAECIYRLRVLNQDNCCPICKHLCETTIVYKVSKANTSDDDDNHKNNSAAYTSFKVWNVSAHPNSKYDATSDILFIKSEREYDRLTSLTSFKCRLGCKSETGSSLLVLSSLAEYKSHMSASHGRTLCDLCCNSQCFFIQEQPLFSKKGLKAHERSKTGSSMAERHPQCQFCHVRFFSSTELYRHLETEHFKCHLCTHESQQYRKNMEQHFRKSHFLCEDSNCLESRYVVFDTNEAYRHHRLMVHGEKQAAMEFNFQYGRTEESSNVALPTTSSSSNTIVPSVVSLNASAPVWVGGGSYTRRSASGTSAFPSLQAESASATISAAPLHPLSTATRRKDTKPAPAAAAVPKKGVMNTTTTSTINLVKRNQNLASAFGIQDREGNGSAIVSDSSSDLIIVSSRDLPFPEFPPELLTWGRQRYHKVVALEQKLDALLSQEVSSVQTSALCRDERRNVHHLCEFYNLASESFDPEPRRYIHITTTVSSKRPPVLLSELVRKQHTKRTIKAAAAPAPGENRGWEKKS